MTNCLFKKAKSFFSNSSCTLKKTHLLVIAALALISLSSCGGSGNSSNNDQATSSSDWGSMQWDQDNWK